VCALGSRLRPRESMGKKAYRYAKTRGSGSGRHAKKKQNKPKSDSNKGFARESKKRKNKEHSRGKAGKGAGKGESKQVIIRGVQGHTKPKAAQDPAGIKGRLGVKRKASVLTEDGKTSHSKREKTAQPGVKRRAWALTNGKASRKKVGGTEAEGEGKKKKILSPTQKQKKEVTKLYSELIDTGRSREAKLIVSDILALLEARASSLEEFCCRKLGSRVVQACLKWGTFEQRRQVLSMLKNHIPKLTQDHYGHVAVMKLLLYSAKTSRQRKPSEEERKVRNQNLRDYLEHFRGKNLHTAFWHRHGCKVVNDIYFSEVVPASHKRRILHEVAIPASVALTRPEAAGSKPLRQLLGPDGLPEDQRIATMEHLREATERAIDKELLAHDVVHLLFQAYCENAAEEKLKGLASECMDGAAYFLSSKPGAEVLMRFLGHASAKQKKDLCRDLKGKFLALAMNSVDYLVVIRLAETVDDTVLLSKTMLAEWKADLSALCFDKYGHRVLAWFFCPADPHLFSPYERNCIALPAPASLKAPDTRRLELTRAVRAPLREVLLGAPLKAAADLQAKDLLVAYLSSDWDAELVEALVACSARSAEQGELDLLGSGTATTALITLLKLEPAETDAPLAMPLFRRCLEPHLATLAASRCAFVLLALLKHRGEVGPTVRSTLKARRAEVEAAAEKADTGKAEVSGAKKLLMALDNVDGA